MSRLSIHFSDSEDIILNNYCKKLRRTKSDVLREYVRSLATAEQELPEGWYESECNGKIEGKYGGYRVVLMVDHYGYDGYATNLKTGEPLIDSTHPFFMIHDTFAPSAIQKMQTFIDKALDS